MTVCNMSTKAARAAGRSTTRRSPTSRAGSTPRKGAAWSRRSTTGARSSPTTTPRDQEVVIDAATLRPTVTWGTNPAQSVTIDDAVPSPDESGGGRRARAPRRALAHGPPGGHADARHRRRHRVHRVVHQCAHRDLRAAAGRARATGEAGVRTRWCLPDGRRRRSRPRDSTRCAAAGFDWREAGCSMCLAMNPDKLEAGERCADVEPQLEGRQGKGGRTHLVPEVAVATATPGTSPRPTT